MLGLPSAVRIYLADEPTDMRKGFDGLARLVEQQGLELYSGHLFVFLSRRRDRVKVLTWERGGLVLYYKRLERGRFRRPRRSQDGRYLLLDAGQLAMLLDGVDWQRAERGRVWEPKKLAG
jgi:transposase